MAWMPRTAVWILVATATTGALATDHEASERDRRRLQSGTPLEVVRKVFSQPDAERAPHGRPPRDFEGETAASLDPQRVTISFANDQPHVLRPGPHEPAHLSDAVLQASAIDGPGEASPQAKIPQASVPTASPALERRTLPNRRDASPPKSDAQPEDAGPQSLVGGNSVATIAAGLAIAVGAFLLLAWGCRKTMPRSASRLPSEAVEVLGRASLTPKQSVHLVRVGNKLVLLSMSPSGVESLTEITDPNDVNQVLTACHQRGAHSASSEFRQVLTQYATAGNDASTPGGTHAAKTAPMATGEPTSAPSFSLWEDRRA